MAIMRELRPMAMTAPPIDAFFSHQVVMRFHSRKARKEQRNTMPDRNFGSRHTTSSTTSNGMNAMKIKGKKPWGNQANPKSAPLSRDNKYNWYLFTSTKIEKSLAGWNYAFRNAPFPGPGCHVEDAAVTSKISTRRILPDDEKLPVLQCLQNLFLQIRIDKTKTIRSGYLYSCIIILKVHLTAYRIRKGRIFEDMFPELPVISFLMGLPKLPALLWANAAGKICHPVRMTERIQLSSITINTNEPGLFYGIDHDHDSPCGLPRFYCFERMEQHPAFFGRR